MNKTFNKERFARFIILTLIITTLLTCCVVGVFARYKTEITGTGTARVAKFEVDITDSGAPQSLDGSNYNGDTQILNYEFTITNGSEVVVDYNIIIDFGTALPSNMSLTIDGKSAQVVNETRTRFEFDGWSFALNETGKEHTLSIIVKYVDTNGNAFENNLDTAVKIIVEAEQAN